MNKQRLFLTIAALCLSLMWAGGLLAQAETDFDCASIAPPGAGAAYYIGLGNAYFSERRYNDAIVAYTCGITADPDYAPAYINRGYAYATQGNEGRAFDDYNQALDLDELLVSGYVNRGVLYTNQGNFGLALLDLDLAIALEPDNAIAYNNRAVVHAAEGNYDLALSDVEQAITLEPDYAAPHATLGVIYSAMAIRSYQRYLSIAGENSRLPAGEPDTVINDLADSLQTGNFALWLPLQTPAR